jgi:hypothetical protein
MHPLISKLFEKKKIKSTADLSPEERQDFDRWQGIFDQGEMTVDKIAVFCRGQQKLIERGWRDLSNPQEKNERSLLLHMVYGVLLEAIEGPKAEREALEKYLTSLLAQP